jgi:hypothetical protein
LELVSKLKPKFIFSEKLELYPSFWVCLCGIGIRIGIEIFGILFFKMTKIRD